MPKEVLLGNQAIGYALAANGVSVMAAYPGTPSSEILPAVLQYSQRHDLGVYCEWSVNEKVALDQAYAAAMAGLRGACAMKQVGLNVAADSFFSAAYLGSEGGFMVVSADDPGPQSSQTEQDSRLMAFMAKVPVLDPSSPAEAMAMVAWGLRMSERFKLPYLLRPGVRVCHAKQAVNLPRPRQVERRVKFKRDPFRWAATPKFRFLLHRELNRKLARIARVNQKAPFNQASFWPAGRKALGIIAAGTPAATTADVLASAGLADKVPLLRLGAPWPFPAQLVERFAASCRSLLVIEETDTFLELLAPGRSKLRGRLDGSIPGEGELTPQVVRQALDRALSAAGRKRLRPLSSRGYEKIAAKMELPVMRPRLCPGCGHRAAFWAMKKAHPKAIFPSDIGCYTLGLNLRAVDTVLDMGAGITLASGLWRALSMGGQEPVVIATIGDSTFYHSGTAGLINAVYNDARFVLLVLDNRTTAMTGMQPTPDLGLRPDGSQGRRADLERLIRGCGVDYVTSLDAYQVPDLVQEVERAYAHASDPAGGPAVIIAHHPCRIASRDHPRRPIRVTEACTGCRVCQVTFECPALVVAKKGEMARIDPKLCVDCGVCQHICPEGALELAHEA